MAGRDREILATGGSKEYVQEIVRADGEHVYFHNRKKALNLADGRRYLLAQYADITDIKRIEHNWRATRCYWLNCRHP